MVHFSCSMNVEPHLMLDNVAAASDKMEYDSRLDALTVCLAYKTFTALDYVLNLLRMGLMFPPLLNFCFNLTNYSL